MIRIIYIVLAGMLLTCSHNTEKSPVIDEDTFVAIYCDVVSQAEIREAAEKTAFVDSVLNYYHVSRQDFENTVLHYSEDPSEWKRVFDKILKELEHRLTDSDSSINETNATVRTKL